MDKFIKIHFTGKIREVGEIQSFSSGFKKRVVEIELETNKYPNVIPVTFKKDDCSIADGFQKGDIVTVTGFLQGNIYTKKDASGKSVGKTMIFLEINGKEMSEFNEDEQAREQAEEVPDEMPDEGGW